MSTQTPNDDALSLAQQANDAIKAVVNEMLSSKPRHMAEFVKYDHQCRQLITELKGLRAPYLMLQGDLNTERSHWEGEKASRETDLAKLEERLKSRQEADGVAVQAHKVAEKKRRESITSLDGQIGEKRDKLAGLENQKKSLASDIEVAEAKESSNKVAAESLVAALEASDKRYVKDILNLESARKHWKSRAEAAQPKAAEHVDEERETLRQERKKAVRRVNELESKYEGEGGAQADLVKQKGFQDKLVEVEKSKASLEQQVADQNDIISGLQRDLVAEQTRFSLLEENHSTHSASTSELKRLRETVSSLEHAQSSGSQDLEKERQALNDMTKERDRLQEDMARHEEEQDGERWTVNRLRKERNELREQVLSLQQQNAMNKPLSTSRNVNRSSGFQTSGSAALLDTDGRETTRRPWNKDEDGTVDTSPEDIGRTQRRAAPLEEAATIRPRSGGAKGRLIDKGTGPALHFTGPHDDNRGDHSSRATGRHPDSGVDAMAKVQSRRGRPRKAVNASQSERHERDTGKAVGRKRMLTVADETQESTAGERVVKRRKGVNDIPEDDVDERLPWSIEEVSQAGFEAAPVPREIWDEIRAQMQLWDKRPDWRNGSAQSGKPTCAAMFSKQKGRPAEWSEQSELQTCKTCRKQKLVCIAVQEGRMDVLCIRDGVYVEGRDR